jgi:hypothetical protein
MKFLKIFFIFFFFLYGCLDIKNLSDEELYEQIQFIEKTNDKNLISYALRNGYKIKLNPNKNENCVKINKTDKIIYVPSNDESKILLEANTIKSLYASMIMEKFELSEILYEVEQLSTYKEIEYILTNFSLDDIKKDEKLKKEMLTKICMYIEINETLDKEIRNDTEKVDMLCKYPLNTLADRENYYLSLKSALESVEGSDYFKIVYDDLLRRVRKGEIKYSEAQEIYARIITLPTKELYRMQRVDINSNLRALKRFKKFYEKEIIKLKNKRNMYKDLVNSFGECYKDKNKTGS